jgi:uncharacterized protein (DUF2236 family)
MQLAHPKVAAGVAEHSRFQENPLGRLYRTMSAMWSIVFDDATRARAALRQVEVIHQRVHGAVRQGEPLPAGAPYDASDQALLFWVHATLVDSAMSAYDLLVAPLNAADRQEYYEDSKKLARLFGIQETNIPSSLAAFEGYLAATMESETIAVGPTARSLARQILYPDPWLLKPAAPVFRLLTAGLLPEKLRGAYGLTWDGPREKRFSLAAGAIRGALPLVPPPLRIVPNARKSERARRR